MPGENREQLTRAAGGGGGGGGVGTGDCGGGVAARRESPRSGEPDSRNRGLTTMIPLPRTGQFAFVASQNQKIAKTEKNRLRLIMENRGAVAVSDVHEKERKIGMRENVVARDKCWRSSAANCSSIACYREESTSESHRNGKVIKQSVRAGRGSDERSSFERLVAVVDIPWLTN